MLVNAENGMAIFERVADKTTAFRFVVAACSGWNAHRRTAL